MGLQQRRVDGVTLAAGAFTNISRDHLDYHASFEDYFAQKLRLFTELLPRGAGAVVDVDSEAGARVAGVAEARGLKLVSVGRDGKTLRLSLCRARRLRPGPHHRACAASAFAFACRWSAASRHPTRWSPRASPWRPAPKRRPCCRCWKLCRARADASISPALRRDGAPIFVDYAHTPDALAKALDALRPYVANRLLVVFGCGGDRDKGKRPEMGAVAAAKADLAIVTDDNPRSESAAAIRREILAGCPRRHRDRRPRCGNRRRDRKTGARRCSAGRRQGPRDRARPSARP